ncbi:radical SAM protein [Candidatus Albibeggiatoa sp. nov. NOAA]|uniref:B12-binding domain-containing radical SAM protein n=1 Tax=Candidatus Albibeggiatoa sp. nov. NOAA TaxID=3162724 RepID=UPI0032FDFC85|nr:hypothetical protein [Thiotrichaceae bacterium]
MLDKELSDSKLRHKVYLNEFNVVMEHAAYLPLVSGLLRAYAETSKLLRDNYQFMPFLFYRDSPQQIIKQYDNPTVAAFSTSMWNEQLNLEIANKVKQRYPNCLIVFGGPQVPHYPQAYFEQYPFIDIAVRSEGEEAFSEILTRFLDSRDFSNIAGIAWRHPDTHACIRNDLERPKSRDLDLYPSPYIEGLFDDLITARPDLQFQAIVETNRGCPFPCTFCFWGQGGLSRKYRYHGIERVRREIEWCAQHKIKYVFNADSNFGIHRRDAEIAQILVDTKNKYNYPEKFRTCWGKNTDEKIYNIAMLFHNHRLEKGITLSMQSNDEQVLKNIKRQNIKLSTYKNLQLKFNEHDVPVYSELILGLPGENYHTWVTGIEGMLQSGLKNQLFVYHCQVYPNTELADPLYQKQFGILTKRIALTEIHGAIRQDNLTTEYEDIIVTTDSMPVNEWRKMTVFSWLLMTLHSLKLGFFIMIYLHNRYGIKYTDFISYLSECCMPTGVGNIFRDEIAQFNFQVDNLLLGNARGREIPDYGNIYWDEEEASFLRISEDLGQFYDEFLALICTFLREMDIFYDYDEVAEAVLYQKIRIPTHDKHAVIMHHQFKFNFPEYFENCFAKEPIPLKETPQILVIEPKDYKDNKPKYARETILWGRKSGTMLENVKWQID